MFAHLRRQSCKILCTHAASVASCFHRLCRSLNLSTSDRLSARKGSGKNTAISRDLPIELSPHQRRPRQPKLVEYTKNLVNITACPKTSLRQDVLLSHFRSEKDRSPVSASFSFCFCSALVHAHRFYCKQFAGKEKWPPSGENGCPPDTSLMLSLEA